MTFNPDIHHRRSIRLKDYDYSQAGSYFVTICAWQRECLFGDIVDGEMRLNDFGRVVDAVWYGLPDHYVGIELDEYTVMPNHFHGIIAIVGAGFKPAQLEDAQERAGLKPAPTQKQHGLSEIIRGFKTFSSRRINESRANPGCPVWQRNYYERVIRNETELARAREYIVNNPLKWELDHENPTNLKPQP